RKLLALAVLGVAQALPFRASAQRPKLWRVGVLAPTPITDSPRIWNAFVHTLRELGYVEGRNLVIEWRSAEGNYERLPALAVELVNLKVDAILASAPPAISAAKRATTTIPIVMGVSADPVGAGFVKTLARPGANVTGSASPVAEYSPKHLDLLRRVVSRLSRAGVLLNPGNPVHRTILQNLETAGQRLAVIVLAAEARTPREIEAAFEQHARQRVEALIVGPDTFFLQQRQQIAALAAKYRMPTIYPLQEHVEAGGLMSYGHDVAHNFRLAATYVDRIFRGANPSDLAVEQNSKFELVINGKTAKTLGLAIPKDLMLLADKVIE
ncbi:MAG TPA: ABC transporter substrate-binding protein, partial [Burkholderiales bacterium]|nr:ABC transporter substrate-binding protein [Burkholderiales bacterium]